jgi:hypothetical protein
MHLINGVMDTARVRLADMADRLYGCAHRGTTFPMTLPASGTYIVCLECGRHFAYDWTAMRATGRRVAGAAPPALLPVLSEAARGSR